MTTLLNPYGLAWDKGVRHFARRTVNPTTLPLDVTYVAEKALRVLNDGDEDSFIEHCIWAATNAAEEATQRAIMPQTWEFVLDGFPSSGIIRLPRPPLIEITSVTYYDSAGDAGDLTGSPAEYESATSGQYQHAIIRPLANTLFPATQVRPDAVTITYRAGFEDEDDPLLKQINVGILLMVGELYKMRSLSVHEVHNTPSLLQLGHFWQCVDPVLA